MKQKMTSSKFGTLPQEELELLCNAIKDTPWRQVIENMDLPVLGQKRDWFTNVRKAYPYRILPLVEKGKVLDIGAGSGVISETIAKDFSSVIAFDYSPELIEFMRKRFFQDGLDNIKIVRADAVKLPFREDCFDLVIVNGVLEWIPDFTPQTNPYRAQIDFLKNVHFILKKRGMVGLAIENRFYFRHFQGLSPHGEGAFVAILPRFMATLITRLKEKKQYRNYIYSYWGYKRLLRKAGFRKINIYVAVPSYYDPHAIISTQKESSRVFFNEYFKEHFLNNPKIGITKKTVYYLLNYMNLFRYLEHSFFITGEK
jgi:ubiquinone/menaquinone biosynthesis C-methylase UbiE